MFEINEEEEENEQEPMAISSLNQGKNVINQGKISINQASSQPQKFNSNVRFII